MLAEETDVTDQLTYGDRPKILIVEDDHGVAEMLRDHLDYSLSADIAVAACAEEAVRMDQEDPAEIILIDYMLPDTDGAELIRVLNRTRPRPAILITGHATLGRAITAMRNGAVDMFIKPFDLEILTRKIARAVEDYRAAQRRLGRLEKVRRLAKQLIKDRRQLRRKLDLVCRDIVNGYRDLAAKVGHLMDGQGQGPP